MLPRYIVHDYIDYSRLDRLAAIYRVMKARRDHPRTSQEHRVHYERWMRGVRDALDCAAAHLLRQRMADARRLAERHGFNFVEGRGRENHTDRGQVGGRYW